MQILRSLSKKTIKISEPSTTAGSEILFLGKDKLRGKTVVLLANTAWNILHFRKELILQLQCHGARVVCIAPNDEFGPVLAQDPGVEFIPLKYLSRKSLSLWNNLCSAVEIRRVVGGINPDLLLTFTIKPNIYGAFAKAKAKMAVVEGLGYLAHAPKFLRSLIFIAYRLAFLRVNRAVFLNQDDRARFLYDNIISLNKAVVLKGSGVDTRHYQPRQAPPSPEFVFLFVGRLLEDKGIREFVRAAETLRGRYDKVRFQILGKIDPDNPASVSPHDLETWISGGAVEYLGYVQDVRPAIARASVVVLPSYGEGMPRALLEAMAMGKPLITTDSPGCRDTVVPGKNGLIVPAGNADAPAQAMETLLRLPGVRLDEMGRVSREIALAEFADDAVLPQWLQAVADLTE